MTALMKTYSKPSTTLVKGEGAYLWDDTGKRYLDALSGIAVCGLGYSHPAVTEAIQQQSGALLHCSNLYGNELQNALGELITTLSGMDSVFFSNSGTEANEAAIKIARKYGSQRGIDMPQIITTENSFHGRTLAALSATGNKKIHSGFTPLVSGFSHAQYNQIAAIEAAASDSTVAVMVEPVQGEGGINVPAADYLNQLRTLCDQRGWLLILDEIQTGNGRSGEYYACHHNGILPDVMTTAKGMGNGVPIGACLARGHAAELLQPGSHGSTFGGNPLACAAAIATLTTIRDQGLHQRARQLGRDMIQSLRHALEGEAIVKDIRGMGLLIGIQLQQPCAELVEDAKQQDLLINVTAGDTVRLLPPLIISDSQAGEIVEKVALIIKSFAKQSTAMAQP
ncbi:MAG: aspartate aminotransferase family protein [Cellvibrionaceae bacterium]|nr:aspartate aminotransferase family protein [Cellvibrionaceae bacterium]